MKIIKLTGLSLVSLLACTLPLSGQTFTTVVSEDFGSASLPASLEQVGTDLSFAGNNAQFTGTTSDYATRTYLRTTAGAGDFFSHSFRAEVTVTQSGQVISFFGVGTGQPTNTTYEPNEPTINTRGHSGGLAGDATNISDNNLSYTTPVALGNGTHRMRLTWDADSKTAVFEFDQNYSGGAFTADATSAVTVGADNGFNSGNTRIFFGGNGNITFDNFEVQIQVAPTISTAARNYLVVGGAAGGANRGQLLRLNSAQDAIAERIALPTGPANSAWPVYNSSSERLFYGAQGAFHLPTFVNTGSATVTTPISTQSLNGNPSPHAVSGKFLWVTRSGSSPSPFRTYDSQTGTITDGSNHNVGIPETSFVYQNHLYVIGEGGLVQRVPISATGAMTGAVTDVFNTNTDLGIPHSQGGYSEIVRADAEPLDGIALLGNLSANLYLFDMNDLTFGNFTTINLNSYLTTSNGGFTAVQTRVSGIVFDASSATFFVSGSHDDGASALRDFVVSVSKAGEVTLIAQEINGDLIYDGTADSIVGLGFAAVSANDFTVAENLANGSTVGTATAHDEPGTTFSSWTITSGNTNGAFAINSSTGVITVANATALDYETTPSFTLGVTVSDGTNTSAEGFVTVQLTNVNEAPTDITLTPSAIDENNVVGATVGTLTATDPDAGATHTFALVAGTGSTDNSKFSLSSGVLYLEESANYEATPSYSIRVRATDNGTLVYEKALVVTVNDVSETGPVAGSVGDVVTNGMAANSDGTGTIAEYDVLRRGAFMAPNGDLVYPGYLKLGTGSPAVTATDNSGIWKSELNGPFLLARTGTTVPDIPGAMFDILPEVPGISSGGEASFVASLVIGSGGVTTANDSGIWSEMGGSGLSLLIREDDSVPGLPGVLISKFASGVYATATTGAATGEAAFSVTFKGANTKTGILRASVNAATTSVQVVAQEGTPAPGTAVNFANLAGGFSDPGRMDPQGNFVFAGLTTPGSKEGIWYQPVGGATTLVVFAGQTAPGTVNATFGRIKMPSMGSNGVIAFRATLNKDGDNLDNKRNDGIWRVDANTPASLQCILRCGDDNTVVSNLPAGSLVGNPWSGWLNLNNRGAWKAWLDVTGNGINSTADGDVHAIYTDLSGSMLLATKLGDAAPGTTGASFSSFDNPILGGNNQFAFIGQVTGGDTTATNNQGLWRSAPNGGALTLILRKGGSIPTTQGAKVVAKIDVPGSGFTDRRWEQPLMNSSGGIVVLVTFDDGSTSQILIQ